MDTPRTAALPASLRSAIARVDALCRSRVAADARCICDHNALLCDRREVFVVDGEQFCSLECVATHLGEEHSGEEILVCSDAMIARIVGEIEAAFAANAVADVVTCGCCGDHYYTTAPHYVAWRAKGFAQLDVLETMIDAELACSPASSPWMFSERGAA